MGYFLRILGAYSRAPHEDPWKEAREASEKVVEERAEFRKKFEDEVAALFREYPEVISYEGFTKESAPIQIKTKKGTETLSGFLSIKDEHVVGWLSSDGELEYKFVDEESTILADKVKVAKIEAMLKDNDKVRKYCDVVASQLLDDDRQAFNALEGLGYKKERFEAEFYDDTWIKAWEIALKSEFSAKSVEYKGEGIFMLTAI